MLLLKIVILIILLLIFAQDILSRSVYWFLFPLFSISLVVVRTMQHPFSAIWPPVLINLGFLGLQLLLLSLYFSLKEKKIVNVTSHLLGMGDVLFLCSIAFYCTVLNYVFFYIASLLMVLSFWQIFQWVCSRKDKHIPLAGLQSLLFALFLASGWWMKFFDLTDDAWLLNLINK